MAAGMKVEVNHHQVKGLEKACAMLEKEAKRVIGTYDYGWPQLAGRTQRDRERQGFPPNEPLLRSGELRDAIEHQIVSEHEGEVGVPSGESHTDYNGGSTAPEVGQIALWQEMGTSTIPPRPFLAGAAAHKGEEAAEIVGEAIYMALAGKKLLGVIPPIP